MKQKILPFLCILFGLCFFTACRTKEPTVNFYGWGGDQKINEWIDFKLSPYVYETYGVKVNRVPMNIDEILLKLSNEKNNTGKGSMDVIWINGENFYYAQKYNLLYGPFVHHLENIKRYVEKHPGRFTYPQCTDFVGSAFLRTVIYDLVGYEQIKNVPVTYEDGECNMTMDYNSNKAYRKILNAT